MIYLSGYLYVCMHIYICMYVCMYLSVCLSVHVYLSIVLFSLPPKNGREYKKVLLKFSHHPRSREKKVLYFLAKKNGSENKNFFIFSPKIFPPLKTVVKIEVFYLISLPPPPPPPPPKKKAMKINALSHLVHRRQAKKHYLTREFFTIK